MKRFNSFQGLRVIAFLLVFFSHCTGFLPLPSGGHGAIGVEIFFVMSGFLMEVNAKDRDGSLIRQCVDCARKKLRKFYWLHILTMILALVPILLKWIIQVPTQQMVLETVKKIAANVFLVQSWIPDSSYYFSMNAVTWYLSTSMVMYLLFPMFHKWIRQMVKIKTKLVCILLIYAFQLALAVALQNSEYMHAVVYIHPLVRCLDFLSGVLLGSIYKQSPKNLRRFLWTWLEIGAVGMLAFVVLMFTKLPQAFSYVTLSAPAAWVLLFVFSQDGGMISQWLSWKPIVFLGNISFELFMIHHLVIKYWAYVLWLARRILHRDIPGVLSTICVLGVSIAAAWILHVIGKKLHSCTMRINK